MPPLTLQTIAAIVGIITASGIAGWVLKSRRLHTYEDLDKRYLKIDYQTKVNQDFIGFREVLKAELADMEKQVEGSNAKSSLAVHNADVALAKAQEVAHTLERVHERELNRLSERLDEQSAKMETLLVQMVRLNTQLSERFPPRRGSDHDDSR